MILRHVEYFLAVVEHGGVLRAARATYVSQPSISQAIRKLEAQLGVDLFERSGRSLALTAAGEEFLTSARDLMEEITVARAKIEEVRAGRAGRLNIATTGTLAIDPLTDLLADFLSDRGGLTINVVEPGGSAEVASTVRKGECELGLLDLEVPTDNLVTYPIATQELILAGRTSLLRDVPDPVDLEAPGSIPLLTEPAVTRLLPDSNTALRLSVESTHRHAIWQLVREGTGATLLPRSLAKRLFTDVRLLATVPAVTRKIGFVARPDALSKPARELLKAAGVGPDTAEEPTS